MSFCIGQNLMIVCSVEFCNKQAEIDFYFPTFHTQSYLNLPIWIEGVDYSEQKSLSNKLFPHISYQMNN